MVEVFGWRSQLQTRRIQQICFLAGPAGAASSAALTQQLLLASARPAWRCWEKLPVAVEIADDLRFRARKTVTMSAKCQRFGGRWRVEESRHFLVSAHEPRPAHDKQKPARR